MNTDIIKKDPPIWFKSRSREPNAGQDDCNFTARNVTKKEKSVGRNDKHEEYFFLELFLPR